MCEKNDNGGSFASGAVLGSILGFALGVLLAPDSGTNTRKKIKDTGQKYIEDGKEKFEEFKDKAEPYMENLQEKLAEVKEKAEPYIADFQERVVPVLQDLEEKARSMSDPIGDEIAEKIQDLTGAFEEKPEPKKKPTKKRLFNGLK